MMKVQKHTGFVAITLTKPVDNYRRGRTHGFMPEQAREILRGGNGKKADVPDSVKYTEVWDGLSDEASRGAGDRRIAAVDDLSPPNGNPDPGSVVIPDDWAERNHFTNIKTAKEILGDPTAPVKTKVEAEEIIRKELDRRAAAGE